MKKFTNKHKSKKRNNFNYFFFNKYFIQKHISNNILTKEDHIAFGGFMNHARCIILYVTQPVVNTNVKVAKHKYVYILLSKNMINYL